MRIRIYDSVNVATALSTDVEAKGGQVTKALNGRYEISFSTVLESYVDFAIGSAIEIAEGEASELYVMLNLPNVIKKSETWYEYTFVFKSLLFNYDRAAFMFEGQSIFPYTGRASDFVTLLLLNVNGFGFDETWTAGTVEDTEYKTLEFNDNSCLGVLNLICSEFDLEYEYSCSGLSYEISLVRKIGNVTAIELEYGKDKGLYEITRTTNDAEKLITRLYYQGSDKNIPNGYGHRYLQGSTPYIESANIAVFGRHDGQKTFDEIHPSRTGTVTGFTISLDENDKEEYFMADTSFPFDLMEKIDGETVYLIPGTTAKINLLTGDCAGSTFEIEDYDHDTFTFKLIPFDYENGYRLPNSTVKPGAGDTYTITDIRLPLDSSYITDATDAVDAAAAAHLALNDSPKVAYVLNSDPVYMSSAEIEINIGDIVTVNNPDLPISASVRVIEVSYPLDDLAKKRIVLSDIRYTSKERNRVIELAKISIAMRSSRIIDAAKNKKSYKTTDELKRRVFDYRDNYFIPENNRKESLDPYMLALDSGEVQFSMKSANITTEYAVDGEDVTDNLNVAAGEFIHHSIKGKTRAEIKKLLANAEEYHPERVWTIAGGAIPLADTATGYFIYAKLPLDELAEAAEIIVDENHLWAKSEEDYIIYKLGYVSPVADGKRTLNVLWGSAGEGGGGADKFISLTDTPASYPATNRGNAVIVTDEAAQFASTIGQDASGAWIGTGAIFTATEEPLTGDENEATAATVTGNHYKHSVSISGRTAGAVEVYRDEVLIDTIEENETRDYYFTAEADGTDFENVETGGFDGTISHVLKKHAVTQGDGLRFLNEAYGELAKIEVYKSYIEHLIIEIEALKIDITTGDAEIERNFSILGTILNIDDWKMLVLKSEGLSVLQFENREAGDWTDVFAIKANELQKWNNDLVALEKLYIDFLLTSNLGAAGEYPAIEVDELTEEKTIVWKEPPVGEKGDKGDPGDPGAPGAPGEKGDKGDPGDPASMVYPGIGIPVSTGTGWGTSIEGIKTINMESLLGTGNINLQVPLVSGTNIKTINNQSLLGAGNIEISGGFDRSLVYVTPDNENKYIIDCDAGNYFVLNNVAKLTEVSQVYPPDITIVGSASQSFGISTSGTLTLPSGLQENDIVVVAIGSDGSMPGLPSGWTNITNNTQGTEYTRVCWKRMGSTPDTTFAVTGISTSTAGLAIAFRNCAALDTDLFEATTTVAGGLTGMPNPPAITAWGSMLLIIGLLDDDSVESSVTAPSGFDLRVARQSGTTGQTVMAATQFWFDGAIDPAAFGGTGTDEWVAVTIALKQPPPYQVETDTHPVIDVVNFPASVDGQAFEALVEVNYVNGEVSWGADFAWIGEPSELTGQHFFRLFATDDEKVWIKEIIENGGDCYWQEDQNGINHMGDVGIGATSANGYKLFVNADNIGAAYFYSNGSVAADFHTTGSGNVVTFSGSNGSASIDYTGAGYFPALYIQNQQIKSMALYQFWEGTQAEYDALGYYDDNTIYHIDEE